MANNNGCGGRGRRNSNSSYGCLNNLGGRWRWDNFPYYGGPCPDADGVYDCDRSDGGDAGCGCDGERSCRRQRRRGCYGLFTAMLPMAISPNGIIPLVTANEDGVLAFRLPEITPEENAKAQILMGALKQGLTDLADTYPRNVTLTIQSLSH